ncbi:class I SAM-dependent methyltransferase [Microbacterium esteraromaticum]|uniref:class I SAM-dependent methyltransferase n=1 Tax=Microbacterium esteraromaticum TaxID=57043 RepID=UPI0015CCFC18|nr:class I SAM-dependent methyltransferase [Microbacterium esteraromaticum]MBY6061376.1 class I SAM-dependent methyltransferase [Microbacterium esteraromaticum]
MVDQTLARSFLTAGADYDRYRPGFPAEAADAIVPASARVALDLGAGTGKFTELLVGRVDRVIAVEPSEQMLAILRAKLPGVETMIGAAESIPASDHSVDVVTVAQAFHWFDREPACAEIARVLVPGGVLGLLWNRTDPRCAWDRACHRVAHPAVGDTDETTSSAAEQLPGFDVVERVTVPWAESISRADYIARWHTVSSFMTASDAERARMTADVERILDADPATAGREILDLPQITDVYVYRARV